MADCCDAGGGCGDFCNVFARCRFLRHLGKLMVVLVISLVALSFWAVAGELARSARAAWATASSTEGSGGHLAGVVGTAARVLLLIVFTWLVFMLLWSYFAAMLTDPGRVPRGWHPFHDEEQAVSEMELLLDRDVRRQDEDKRNVRRPRFCRKCRGWKPPRAHHCSVSGCCVLRLDHYCIWLLNAVGLLNYKAFLLFLIYTLAATSIGTVVLAGAVIRSLRPSSAPTPGGGGGGALSPLGPRGLAMLIAFVVDAAFALSLTAFVVLHARLAARNMSTIEQFEKAAVVPWPWDRGSAGRNLAEVFGQRPGRWWVPQLNREEAAAALRAALCA